MNMVILGSQTRGDFDEKWFGKQKYLSGGYKSIIFVNIDVWGITENFFMSFGYKLITIAPLEVTVKSSWKRHQIACRMPIFRGQKKLKKLLCLIQKLLIIKQKGSYIDSHKWNER